MQVIPGRQTVNLAIDTLALLAGGALTGSGLILAYRLPSGRGQRDMSLLGWNRHEWGDVHLILAWVVIGLVVMHLLLHLNWLAQTCSMVAGHGGPLGRRWVLPVLLALATGAFLALPWLLPLR